MSFHRKFLLRLLISASVAFLVSGFTCADVTKSSQCTQLNGCSWSGTACSGTFSPSCVPPACYYVVDSSISVALPDGSVENPYTTLTDPMTKIAANEGIIIIINTASSTSVNHYKSTSITGTITVQPMFSDSHYRININSTTSPFFSVRKTLKISGAYISHNFTASHVVFDIQNNVLLYLENVNVFNNFMNSFSGFFLRISSSSYTNATYQHIGGYFANNTARSQLAGGISIFKDLAVVNMTTGNIFALGGTVTFNNVFFSNIISSNFLQASSSVTLSIVNCQFDGIYSSLFSATTAKMITLKDSTFQNIFPPSGVFATYKGDGGTHYVTNCTFENIAISHTLFYPYKGGIELIFQDVKMNKISKSSESSSSDLEYDSKWVGGLACLSSDDAIVRVYNSSFTNFDSHCFGFKSSLVDIQNSTFDNSLLDVEAQDITEDLLSTLAKNSGVTWINIEDASQSVSGGTSIIISNNNFIENKKPSLYGGAIRFTGLNKGQMNAYGNTFVGNKAAYGGAIYGNNILLAFNLTDNVFLYNSAYDGGAVYKVADEFESKLLLPSMSTTNDFYYKNSAVRNGGAMLLDWETLYIEDTLFSTGSAENGGGIYFVNLDSYYEMYGSIIGAQFTHNRASNVGGAMKIFFELSSLNQEASEPSVYVNNTDHLGEAISSERPQYYLFSFYDVIVEKTFTELDDLSDWTSNPQKTRLAFTLNTSEGISTTQVKHKSGHEMMQIVKIEIYDGQDQLADYISNEYFWRTNIKEIIFYRQLTVQIAETVNNKSDFKAYVVASPVYLTFTNGVVYIKTTLKMIGEPLSTAVLNFQGLQSSSNMLSALGLLMNYDLNILFIKCEVGDVYDDSTKTCDTCVAGTYSFDEPYNGARCYQCESEQETCLGGSKIAPKPGYWRYDITKASVLECPASEACKGGLVDDVYYPEGLCDFPYEGNLCNKCAPNYAKFGSEDTCSDCAKDGVYYIKFLVFFILRIGAVVYSVKCNLDKLFNVSKSTPSKETVISKSGKARRKITDGDFQSNLMKIAVNFLQVSTVVLQYKFEWPDFIRRAINITNKIIPSGSDGFSVDCIVTMAYGENKYTYFANLIVTLIQPFGVWLIMSGIYLLYLRFKGEKIRGNPRIKKSVVVIFIITGFMLQPTLIQSTLELFKCQNYTPSSSATYFMAEDSEVQCWTGLHILWSVGVALPFFLLWGFVLPIVLFRKLVVSKDLENAETYTRFAFIYEGMKKKRYYWEFVILIRKTLVVLIFVFLNVISVQAQAFATFLVLLVFSALQIKIRPYCDKRLNRLELLSLITLLVMTYSGMFFLSGGSTDALNLILIILSLIFNIVFYLTLGLYFVKSNKKASAMLKKFMAKKGKPGLERSKTRKNSNSNSSSSDNIESSDSSKRSAEIKDLEDIIDEIQIDSPSKAPDENAEEDQIHRKDSESPLSDIPVESFSDLPSRNGNKMVYNGFKNENSNHSVLRNSGYLGVGQNSFNASALLSPHLLRGQSFNSSGINLLSPHLSTDRKLLDSNLLKPGKPMLEKLDVRGLQLGAALDSPSSQRLFAADQDGGSSSVSRLQNLQLHFNYDESLLLRIPNSPADGSSSFRSKNDETEKDSHPQ